MTECNERPVKVLQVTIGDGSYGGVASFLYSYYSHMDRGKVHFDFLYCGENSMQSKMDTEVLKDSRITTLHILKANNNGLREYTKLLRELKLYFGRNNYDIVHMNTSNVYVSACIAYALKGRALLISHSHNTRPIIEDERKTKKIIKKFVKMPCQKYLLNKADYYFACSKMAGENLFGERISKSNRFRIINNAIDIFKYTYNPQIRRKFRRSNKIVIGHVGRLTKQKNPLFLLEVFAEIHRLNPNSELWMIGEGEMQEEIRKKISNLCIEKDVILWGRRDDVSELMQAMDLLLFPSLYEGLSIVVIEAQAAGLPVICSDSISPEHKVTELVEFYPLSESAKSWAEKISEKISNLPQKHDMSLEMISAGYEIHESSKILENFYLRIGT